MATLFKSLIAVLQIGGGYMITALTLQESLQTNLQTSTIGIFIVFNLISLIGILGGVGLLLNKPYGYPLSIFYQIMQIPYIMTNILVYFFTSGLSFCIIIAENSFNWHLLYGGRFNFAMHSSSLNALGINIIPIISIIFLYRLKKSVNKTSPPNSNTEHTHQTDHSDLETHQYETEKTDNPSS